MTGLEFFEGIVFLTTAGLGIHLSFIFLPSGLSFFFKVVWCTGMVGLVLWPTYRNKWPLASRFFLWVSTFVILMASIATFLASLFGE